MVIDNIKYLKTLVYFILSSDDEVRSLNKKNLKNFLKISKDITFLIVDNRKSKNKILIKKYDDLLIFNQDTPKSLIENISTVTKNYNYHFYIRLDPDDNYQPSLVRDLSKSQGSNNLVVGSYIVKTKKTQFNLNHKNGQFNYFEPLGAGILISRGIQKSILRICKGLRGQDNFALWILLLTRNMKIIHSKEKYTYNQDSSSSGMSRQRKRIIKERLEIIKRIFLEDKTLYFLIISEKNIKPFDFKLNSNIIFLRFFNLGVIAPVLVLLKNFKFKKIKIINRQENQFSNYQYEDIAFCCLTNTSILIKCLFDRSFFNQKEIFLSLKKKNIDINNIKILGL